LELRGLDTTKSLVAQELTTAQKMDNSIASTFGWKIEVKSKAQQPPPAHAFMIRYNKGNSCTAHMTVSNATVKKYSSGNLIEDAKGKLK